MCIQFTCISCSGTFLDHCKNRPAESTSSNDSKPDSPQTAAKKALAATLPNQRKTCAGPIWATEPTRCMTCIRIRGAIKKLENILFQAPFLSTEGLGGLDNLAPWEREDMEQVLKGRKKGWEDKAESREERHEVQARLAAMGLDGAVNARQEHQGFDMSITPAAPMETTQVGTVDREGIKQDNDDNERWW